MKKLLYLLAVLAVIVFNACKSEPIAPNIIGTGIVHEDQKTGHFYVPIGSMTYTIDHIYSSSYRPDDGPVKMAPREGLEVTIFTTPDNDNVRAVIGKQNEQQIVATMDNHVDWGGMMLIFAAYVGTIILLLMFFKF